MIFRDGAWRAALVAALAILPGALFAVTIVMPSVWTGAAGNSNWTTPANWQGNLVPATDGTAAISFGPASRTHVTVDASQNVASLAFTFSTASGFQSYFLSGANGSTLKLGSGGLTTSTATSTAASSTTTSTVTSYFAAQFDSSLGLILGADQTWSAPGGFVYVNGPMSGTGKLTLSSGYFTFSGNNTFSAGTVLNGAYVDVGSNTAFGTGAVTVATASSLFSVNGNRALANALNLNADLTLGAYDGTFTFSGPITLGASVGLANFGRITYLDGAIGETGGARRLSITSNEPVVLSGANTYTGGTTVNYGAVVFRNANSVPATGLITTSTYGYAGIGFATGIQSGFVNRFDKATTLGTIGFDTDPSATSATVFTEPIDLTGFANAARIGTLTRATFDTTALITPQAAFGYRFGGGGGTLTLKSKLTGANSLSVESIVGNELMLNLAGTTNDYTGPTTATHSAIVFGAPGAMPATSGAFSTNTGGYIGTLDAALTPAAFLARFSPAITTGVIGFDSSSVTSPRTVGGTAAPLNLSTFTAGTTIALGTSTAATLSGPITLPPLQTSYYFTGYKGGVLLVNSDLGGAVGVRVGGMADATSTYGYSYPVFDPNDATRISSVSLNGNNTYSGGTSLYGGRLVLGSANALGSGPLTVEQNSAGAVQLHNSLATSPTFANALVIRSDLEIGGLNAFTLSGPITDGVGSTSGLIGKAGSFTLTLSGNNAGFSGGFNLNDGTIAFTGNTAAGTGPLYFGYTGNVPTGATPTAAFTSSTPSIGTLTSYTTGARINVASGTALTINQGWDSSYAGQFVGAGSIEKAGSGTLRLESASASFSGPTKISGGTLAVGTAGALGTGAVTLASSGTLVLDPGVTFGNPLVLGSGAVLAGNGTFTNAVTVGAGSTVSPGNSPGTLTFAAGLTLAGGSTYQFQVQDATGGAGVGWDSIAVTGSLTFTATPTQPFTLSLSSLATSGTAGNAANFVATNAYSWQILSTTTGINGFNANAVFVNSTAFTNTLGAGSFNLTMSGNNLFLNFTPIPEPSTCALLGSGLALLALRPLRRRLTRQ